MRMKLLSVAVTAGLLAACGNGSDGGGTQKGVLLDSAVSGVSYQGTRSSGITGGDGEYSYLPDETITFRIGDVVLGSAQGKGTLLLKDLDGGQGADGGPSRISVNRAIFLQSLDEDGDASNGIQISGALRDQLKSAAISFDQDSAAFTTALTTLLAAKSIGAGVVDADEARAHMLQTEAGATGSVKIAVNDGVVTDIQRFVLPDNLYVPYPGSDAGLKKTFPKGFPLGLGSGLAFDGKSGDTLTFYGITDRGPNADSPILASDKKTATKVFPSPDFAPTLARLTVDLAGGKGVTVSDLKELNRDGRKISGRPVQSGTGSTGEVALNDTMTQALAYDAEGLDTEALVIDPQDRKYAWTCDEYGPFVAKIELATGKIVRKYAPGAELPAVIARRQPNRGCEGLAITPNGKIYAMVQSTLDVPDDKGKSVKDKALFTRIVEIDRSNEASPTVKTFAYPLNPADWDGGKSGKAKLGDLVAVDDTHLLLIEQGAFSDGKIHNKIFLVDIGGATDITGRRNGELELETLTRPADLIAAGVQSAKKTLIGDLRDYGWLMEKTEGLALVDNQTLAIVNDNDFGLTVEATDADGNEADATKLYVDTATGQVTDADGKPHDYKVKGNPASQRRTELWLVKLARPVLDFQQGYSWVQAGDLLNAPLKDFHPTQPAIGYDQIYYKLGRYAMNLDAPNKKFDDYCEDMGQDSAKKANVTDSSRLNDAASFACKDPVGKSPEKMKTAVIGPKGALYLTDGHHSFTSYYETPDGGQDMKVWVRVLANFSDSKTMDEFWTRMKANSYVWLKDGGNGNTAITPEQLPQKLGLGNGLHDDPVRSLIYFTRDIGYAQPANGTEFLEFYWGEWVRAQATLNTLAGKAGFDDYLAAVKTLSEAMVATRPDQDIGGKTAAALGRLDAFNQKEFDKLSKPISDAKPGKLAYALDYKTSAH